MNEATNEFYKQWLIKAQEDWDVIQILIKDENPPTSAVCFHCQQCVEKLIKAVLTQHSIEFPKTHDIGRLIELAQPHITNIKDCSNDAKILTIHGVESRSPDEARSVDLVEMRQVLEVTEKLRNLILKEIE